MPHRLDTLVTAVLTHPRVVALKRPIKDVLWQLRGIGIRNPVLPTAPKSWVFVCKGNICRSPFAALLAERIFAEAGVRGVTCLSAGLDPTQGDRPPLHALEAAAAYDISLAGHHPRAITTEMIENADVVVVMEAQQLARLRRHYPQLSRRFVLLSLFAPDAETSGGYRRFHITDPYGRTKPAFDECYARIDAALRAMFSLGHTRRTTH